MSPAEVLRKAKKRLNSLSPERLRVADDFLAYLEERECSEATEELLRVPGFLDELEQAEADVAAGRLTPVDQLRRKS
jgi:hypothetical protein